MIPLSQKCLRSAISIVGLPLSLAQLYISRRDYYKYKASGEMVDVGSRHLHAVVRGEGSPTVILESGMGGCSLDWSLVQPELSKCATVLAYDRAGLGWSRRPMDRPNCKNYVQELRALLKKMNLQPPYILVGHSFGGLLMRYFAAEHPDEVIGLILVDSTHENRYLARSMTEKRKKQRDVNRKQFKFGYLLSPIAIPRMMKKHIGPNRLPFEIQKVAKSIGYQNYAYKAAYLELLGAEESAQQIVNANPLNPNIPVIVLSAGKQNEEWLKEQMELIKISRSAKHIMVEQSWHSIQIHQPDAVISAVKSLL